MRTRAVAAAIFALAFGLSACGKYGAPVRSVQKTPGAEAGETRQQPTRPDEPILDETTRQPSDFDF
jgi:PBP1b-binding outer membrane lipoprotein LpoB